MHGPDDPLEVKTLLDALRNVVQVPLRELLVYLTGLLEAASLEHLGPLVHQEKLGDLPLRAEESAVLGALSL